MKSDLLKIYVRTGVSSYPNNMIAAACFVAAHFWIYGLSVQPRAFFAEIVADVMLLLFSAMSLLKVKSIYQEILAKQEATQEIPLNTLVQLLLFKFAAMALWLYFLFMPLETHELYSHLIGFFFIFCAISVFSSVNATYLPLFFYDTGLQIAFALLVILMNRDIPETPYVLGLLLMFSGYAIMSGLRMSRITKSLVESGDALEKAAQAAEQANKAKSDFLAMMSHEIRTPMTGILGMVDFLGETPLTQEQQSLR
jgi:signal transduction histidine kinase